MDRNQLEEFFGKYVLRNPENVVFKNWDEEKETILLLQSDGTYKFTGDSIFGLENEGLWETGGIDGLFMFYDESGNLIGFASPYGGSRGCSLSIKEHMFIKTN